MLPLKQHQIEGIEWLHDRPRALLADEAGLGKSRQLLEVAKEPVLIVAPAMVLESGTWDDEIETWTPGIEATQVSYTSVAQRGKRGAVERDSNGFPKTPLKPEYARSWGSVILDEAHYIKGRKTSWSYALSQLKSPTVHCATGTPIVNWAQEAFMLLRMMWPERSKAGQDFGSYWRWAKQWFHVADGRFAKEIGDLRDEEHVETCLNCRLAMEELGLPLRTWEEFRASNWGDRMIRRYRKDCLDLPPFTHQDFHVKMSTEQARVYRALKKDFVTWLDSGMEIDVWSEPGLLVKLAMIATGLEVLDPTAKPSGKLKALSTLLEDRPAPTLVVAHFRDSVDACAQVAERLGLRVGVVRGGLPMSQRRAAIRDFQTGYSDVLCASINTISEGLTLHQAGADQTIRVERSWSPVKNEQVDRRLHRMGVEKPIHSIDLVTLDTVDEPMLQILRTKTLQQIKALGARDFKALV